MFTHGYLQLERLLHWSNRSTFDLAHVREAGKTTGKHKIGTHEEPEAVAIFNDTRISLRVRGTDFAIKGGPVSNRKSLESSEWAVLKFESSGPVSYRAFDTVAKDLQDLLSLSSYAPCGWRSRSLMYETSDTHPGSHHFPNEVELMGRQVYRTKLLDNEDSRHIFLFTLSEIDFPDLIPRWLALKDRARMGCEILFGLRYIETGYVGTRLLGVASAAESIHSSLRAASTPLPRSEYRALKRKLLAAISDESDTIKDFVKNGLRNNPTYNDRMLELASIPDSETVDQLLSDRSRWAAMLKQSRNDLAHANERSIKDDEVTPAFWLLEVTYALLCLVLMAELGVSAEVQRGVLDHPRVHWASFQLRKFLRREIGIVSPE